MTVGSFIVGAAVDRAAPIGDPISTLAGRVGNRILPIQSPEIGELRDMFLKGYLGFNKFRELATYLGYDFSDSAEFNKWITKPGDGVYLVELSPEHVNAPGNANDRAMRNQIYTPTPDECVFFHNRKIITPDLALHYLKRNFNDDSLLASAYLQSAQEIPGPSDLIRFAVREAFSPNVIEAFGYHKEFPVAILPWMDKQGYGKPIGALRPAGATNDKGEALVGQATWSDLFWYAHWELPSISQGYEMLFRLYPDSPFHASPDWTPETTFTGETLELLQKTADIPEFWRKRLQQIAYSPYTRVDVRRMYNQGILDVDQVYHAYRAIGYDDVRANNLKNFTVSLSQGKLIKKPPLRSASWVCKYYREGVLVRQAAETKLKALGFKDKDIGLFLDECDLELKSEELKLAVKDIRISHQYGAIDSNGARNLLVQLGMALPRVNRYMGIWERHRIYGRSVVSASKILDFFVSGIESEEQTTTRLQNMGMFAADITRSIQAAKGKILSAAQQKFMKQQLANQKQAEKVIKEGAKQAKEAAKNKADQGKAEQKSKDEVIKALLSASTDKNLVEWFTGNLITLGNVIYRLHGRKMPTNDIIRWVRSKLKVQDNGVIDAAISQATQEYQADSIPSSDA